MDRFVNKKIEKQTIYEIYRACRLCGAGGGYKMPIIQNVVNLEGCDVELKQKIRECVQIEVRQDDKMPPLICELCVDKVNDFYEFLEMCRQTNKRTRLKLGLPPQMLPRGAPDADDCILGVTEPVFVKDEDSDEPLTDKKSRSGSGKGKSQPERKMREVRVKLEDKVSHRESRSTGRHRAPSPPRLRGGHDRRPDRDNVALSRLQSKLKKSQSPPPKSILKKGTQVKAEPVARSKRSVEADTRHAVPAKKVKISLKATPSTKSQSVPTRGATSKQARELAARKAGRQREKEKEKEREREKERAKEAQTPCSVCGGMFKTPQAMNAHKRFHTVTFTNPKLACDPCALWFAAEAEAAAHHARHKRLRYRCARCAAAHVTLHAYHRHIEDGCCLPSTEVPDVKCASCWRLFPTRNLLDGHRCLGPAARPAACSKCDRRFSSRRSLANHVRVCKKGALNVDPALLSRLRPAQVRVARCDPLLAAPAAAGGRHDVSNVPPNFGLDKNCVYPYISSRLRIKSEPSDCMVKISDYDFSSYVHWDSDDDSGDSDIDGFESCLFTKRRKVESLAACSLKTIFSPKLLGKVPRKLRRVKIESIINSALNDSLSDLNINCSDTVSNTDGTIIDDIVKDSDAKNEEKTDDDDLFPKSNSVDLVTNNDFDSLFGDHNDKLSDGDGVDKSAAVSDDTITDIDSGVNKSADDSLVSGAKENLGKKNNVNEASDKVTNENIEQNRVEDNGNEHSPKSPLDERISDPNKEAELKTVLNLISEDITEDKAELNDSSNSRLSANENSSNAVASVDEDKVQNSKESIQSHGSATDSSSEIKLPEINELLNTVNNKEAKNDVDKLENLTNEVLANVADTSEIEEKTASTENYNENKEDNVETVIKGPEPKINKDIDDNIRINNSNNAIENEIETKVNGDTAAEDEFNMDDLEDLSDGEFDDSNLMADLDAQIGEKRVEDTENNLEGILENINSERATEAAKIIEINDEINAKLTDINEETVNVKVNEVTAEKNVGEETKIRQEKITLEDLLPKDYTKGNDLDSISDEEFDFND